MRFTFGTVVLISLTLLVSRGLGQAGVERGLHSAGTSAEPLEEKWPFDAKEAQDRQRRAAKALNAAVEWACPLGDKLDVTLVIVPPGRFLMGTKLPKEHEENWIQHEVILTRPFYMGKYEVTRGQFAAFVADTGYKTQAEKDGTTRVWDGVIGGGNYVPRPVSWRKPGFEQTDDQPVVYVSWDDAVEFCKWASKKTTRAIALPTEAQWEYACRAGTATAYPWGETLKEGKGYYHGLGQEGDEYTNTAPVGKFKPNAFGLHDMIGNVTEWVADRYAKKYYRVSEREDPQGPDTGPGDNHMTRGGHSNAWTSYTRFPSESTFRHQCFGFRVVMAADGSASRPASMPSSQPASR